MNARSVPGTMLHFVVFLLLLPSGGKVNSALITDEGQAHQWLEDFNTRAEQEYNTYSLKSWAYNTNLTDYNENALTQASITRANFRQEAYHNASMFDWRNFQNATIKRLFGKVTDIGSSSLQEDDFEQYTNLNNELKRIYSEAEVCTARKCYPLSPDLTQIIATSRDWDELLWAWKGWRDVTGPKMKDKYEEFVELSNKAAVVNEYTDTGEYWRSGYELGDDFEPLVAELWEQVKPLYQQLHAYVKRKLQERYKGREFPSSGHIPAHLLGNMWAQDWVNLLDIVLPYPNKPALDVTAELVGQGYDAKRMFNISEEFFTSLGLEPMPPKFWQHSMIEKPADRNVVCHASAWDLYGDSSNMDFRIKQCTDITQRWLFTTHHEMGHVQYYLQYNTLPVLFRRGANPGFHEAVGDVLSLSVSTPEHLKAVGLLQEIANDTEYDLNFLMSQALDKISFLPFGFMIDQWRWSVFRGDTPKEEYNKKWWDLRCQLQGVSPPVGRENTDFDPGAKYHIPANTPYIRYFVSFIIQFQFHQALCDAAGVTGPLHRCDIYKSMEAGKKLSDMLKLGSSQPWPEAMEKITGDREMDAGALMKFFQPLTDWLTEQNEGHDITWDSKCPDGSFLPPTTSQPPTGPASGGRGHHAADILTCLITVLFYSLAQ